MHLALQRWGWIIDWQGRATTLNQSHPGAMLLKQLSWNQEWLCPFTRAKALSWPLQLFRLSTSGYFRISGETLAWLTALKMQSSKQKRYTEGWKVSAKNIAPDLLNGILQPWFGWTWGLTVAVPQTSVKLFLKCHGISKRQHHPPPVCTAEQGIYSLVWESREEDVGVKGGVWSIKGLCERAALFTGISLSCDCGILPFSSDGFHFSVLKEINKLRVMLFWLSW